MTEPSINPSNNKSLQGTFTHVLEKFLQGIDDMIPAKVISFDRETNRATVKPLIMVLKTDGNTQSRAEIASVPVFQYSGGGFVINFPLKKGDLGWLKANDRDISLFKQSYSDAAPNTLRKHNFSDAMFFPDTMRGWTIEEDGLVIQSLDGSQCVAILDDMVKIKGTDISILGSSSIVAEADTITLTATEITLDSPLTTITGAIEAGASGGNAVFNGTIQTTGDVISDVGGKDVSLTDHVHSGVMSGGSNTGEPV